MPQQESSSLAWLDPKTRPTTRRDLTMPSSAPSYLLYHARLQTRTSRWVRAYRAEPDGKTAHERFESKQLCPCHWRRWLLASHTGITWRIPCALPLSSCIGATAPTFLGTQRGDGRLGLCGCAHFTHAMPLRYEGIERLWRLWPR